MACRLKPQPNNPRPLDEVEAREILGPEPSAQDLVQAQKLFTCAHGITLNWRRARLRLGLPISTAPEVQP
jgi:hypothetical protein